MPQENEKKAVRNKTMELDLEQGNEYLKKCLVFSTEESGRIISVNNIIDKTVFGDAFEMMKLLPEKFADLLIVDPPYNMHKNFHGNKFKRVSNEEYAEFTRKWVEAVRPLLSENASLYVCCDWRSCSVIENEISRYFIIRNRITWQREKGRGAKSNWKNSMEDIWFATVSDKYIFNAEAVKQRRRVIAPYKENGNPKDWFETPHGNFRDSAPSNFWDDISVPYWSMPENTPHPTQKPEKLLAKLILASSEPGDIVFDPFAGSGSTLVTAKKLGRRYVGIEQNPQYCAWSEKRLELAEKDKSIQGFEDGVFWERNTSALQNRFKNKKTDKSK